MFQNQPTSNTYYFMFLCIIIIFIITSCNLLPMDEDIYFNEKYELSSFTPGNNSGTPFTTPFLHWNCNGKAAGFHLQLGTSDDFSPPFIVDDKTLTENSYQVTTPLEESSFYYWRIRIKTKNGNWENWCHTIRFYIIGEFVDDGFEIHDGTFSTLNNWILGGDKKPYVQDHCSHYGDWAVQFGDIDDNEESYFETSVHVSSSMTISFWVRVDGEYGCDYLKFYIDDLLHNRIYNTSLSKCTVTLTSGIHTLQWKYCKDSSISQGADTAWVDDISIY